MTTETGTLTPEQLGFTAAAMDRLGGTRMKDFLLTRQGIQPYSLRLAQLRLRHLAYGGKEQFDNAAQKRRFSRDDFATAQTVFDKLAADFEENGIIENDQHDAISHTLERRSQPIAWGSYNLPVAGLFVLGGAIAESNNETAVAVGGLIGAVIYSAASGINHLRRRWQAKRPQGRHAAP